MLSCVTTLALSLIQPCSSLDCLPSSASMIPITANNPMKTKSHMNVQISKPDYKVGPESHQWGRRSKYITSNAKHTYFVKQSAEVSVWKSMRPKHITSTDQSTHITKHEATVSNQEGMRPKLNTSKEQSPVVCSELLQCIGY